MECPKQRGAADGVIHDGEIKAIFGAIRQLMTPVVPKKGKIGFRLEKDK